MNFPNTKKADLVELSVLMPQDDLTIVKGLKDKESVTRDELALLGDIILSNMRCYC